LFDRFIAKHFVFILAYYKNQNNILSDKNDNIKSFLLEKQKNFTVFGRIRFIPASNEPSDCLQAFGDCREGQTSFPEPDL